MIQKARTIYIISESEAREPLAELLGFYLNMMFENVRVIKTSSVSEIFEQMLRIGPEDVVVGISFPEDSTADVESPGICQQPECRKSLQRQTTSIHL